ncbi:GNAT family N-acetyltransferase [Streptomyces abyssomicinicus]|uniref:GNAT family N-acetyltransferase n=1 Tax=Streptomyces abyssomicinicus TaxID=574929 RepID=UPI001250270D|nr:GNAT family N-acetyltransferase [Streptomyces abyssomicinicus]
MVREMRVADCARVAEIRIAGWRHAYRGLVPQPYLDRMDPAAAAKRHRKLLTGAGPGVVNLVAEHGGRVAGWACLGPNRDAGPGSEVYALYVDPAHHRTGIGSALLRHCLPAGRTTCVWVVKGNTPARRFYAHHGFTPDGTQEPFIVDGAAIPEVRYVRRSPGGPPSA